jgi:hypothetical protein
MFKPSLHSLNSIGVEPVQSRDTAMKHESPVFVFMRLYCDVQPNAILMTGNVICFDIKSR